MRSLLVLTALLNVIPLVAQRTGYWQQQADYKMEIDVDAPLHRFSGTQELTYTNNSPDTLYNVYYHLYFNAFQPGSEMDRRSAHISDPDPRVAEKINKLKPEEQGYHEILSLMQDGKQLNFRVVGSILEVDLLKPVKPGGKTVFTMLFKSQVPVQIRRSGYNNEEGIEFSMTQWYPKLCEYDAYGWNANPYIGREFHGVWGSFDVKITMDSAYVLAGTGVIQNPQEVGHGYENGKALKRKNDPRLTWHFKAAQVHDFAWAADKEYMLYSKQVENGPLLYMVYQPEKQTSENWPQLGDYMAKAITWMSEHYGKYPYPVYSFIQGGDGGMEYPMCTLITGRRNLSSLVGVSVHELNHSWFQGVLAFNESLYGWMDEGFTTYTSVEVMNYLYGSEKTKPNFKPYYDSYFEMVKEKIDEPLTTHADFYLTNKGYGINVYNKGAITLNLLRYIVGEGNYKAGMKRFFDTWKFRHPVSNDLKRILEKQSGMNLSWFFEQWVNTTHKINYAIGSVMKRDGKTYVQLHSKGDLYMPLEVTVEKEGGVKEQYYIPLQLMRKYKTEFAVATTTLPAWNWTDPDYIMVLEGDIKSVEIDAAKYLPDVDREDNKLELNGAEMLLLRD